MIRVNFNEDVSPVDQIREALSAPANAVRVIDLFRSFDENDDGEISVDEFFFALRMLGIGVSREVRLTPRRLPLRWAYGLTGAVLGPLAGGDGALPEL